MWWLEVNDFFQTPSDWPDEGPINEHLSRDYSAIIAALRERIPKPPKGIADQIKRQADDIRATHERQYNQRQAEEIARIAERQEAERIERERKAQEDQARASRANGRSSPQPTDCLYAVLGLGFGSPFDVVKASYRRLVKQHHPDKGGDPERFQAIQEAYETIRDSAWGR